jgi:hypothetical protein
MIQTFEDFFPLPPVSQCSTKFETAIRVYCIGTPGLGGNWYMKKPEVENLVALSL